jgi:hypothetical protein
MGFSPRGRGRIAGFGIGRPAPMTYVKLPVVKTFAWTDDAGNTHVQYHETVVVSFNDDWITLRTGGYNTLMTKTVMNGASTLFGLGFEVFTEMPRARTRDFPSRRIGNRKARDADWFVEFKGAWPFDHANISLNRKTGEMTEGDMVRPTSSHYACKKVRSNPQEDLEEGDITTTDHEHWYQYGRPYVTGNDLALAEAMVGDRFFPNVWFISDHGNVIPHDISKAMRIAELKNRSKIGTAQTKKYLPGGGWVEQKKPRRSRSRNVAMSGDAESSGGVDVEVDDQGNIVLFKLASDEAKTWWSENVSPGRMIGGRYVVEHRYADSVIEGMMADGLNVR